MSLGKADPTCKALTQHGAQKEGGFSRSSLTSITVGQLGTDLNPRMDFRSIQAPGRLPGWKTSECMLPACSWCWCLHHLQSKCTVPDTSWLSSKNEKERNQHKLKLPATSAMALGLSLLFQAAGLLTRQYKTILRLFLPSSIWASESPSVPIINVLTVSSKIHPALLCDARAGPCKHFLHTSWYNIRRQ